MTNQNTKFKATELDVESPSETTVRKSSSHSEQPITNYSPELANELRRIEEEVAAEVRARNAELERLRQLARFD